MVVIEVPPQYGWLVLGAGIGTYITSFVLSGPVMKARDQYNVPYPNLYAVPGYHKNADEFNRVQRSHQNYLENMGAYVTMALIGGLKYPIANALGAISFCVGSILYQKGYVDTSLDVKMARYKKGGVIKWIGVLIALYSTGSFAYDLITSA
jgi:glutathione S-transferase